MNLLVALILILGVVIIYMFFVNLYSVLFQITGLPKSKCKFQVISLFTNCGYTTKESEMMMTTPARRNIALATMLTGNIFSILIMSLLINLVSSFSIAELQESYIYFIITFGVFLAILILNNLPINKKLFATHIARAHHRIHKDKIPNDITVMDSYGQDVICELDVHALPNEFLDKPLNIVFKQLPFKFNVLLLMRKNRNVTVNGDTIIQAGDTLIVFGNYKELNDLFINGDIKDYYMIDNTDNLFDIVLTNSNNALVTVTLNQIPESLKNKNLLEMNLTKSGLNVLFIMNNDQLILANKDTTFNVGEKITIFGDYQTIKNTFTITDK